MAIVDLYSQFLLCQPLTPCCHVRLYYNIAKLLILLMVQKQLRVGVVVINNFTKNAFPAACS